MSDEAAKDPVAALSDLLDLERLALLEGKLDEVGSLLDPKVALIAQVNSRTQADPTAVRALDQKVKRNQRLLGGALEGIRSVADRMARLRRVQTSLETYGADGQRRDILLKPIGTVERRA